MKYLSTCVVLALKSFLSSCCKCSSLHPKRPKGRERCAKPVAGKRLAQNIGTPMYLSASVRGFVQSEIVHINPLLKAIMFQVGHFVKAMLYFIWHSLKGFTVLKEIEIILSVISFFIFTFWLQKFLEAIFYCIVFLLDFRKRSEWRLSLFTVSDWIIILIKLPLAAPFLPVKPIVRTRSVAWALNCKIRWQKKDMRTFNKV